MKKINIAVDGTAGSGKSSIMKKIAQKFNMNFIDTGVMYRAFTKLCLLNNVNFLNDQEIEEQLKNFNYQYINENSILVNNQEFGQYLSDYKVVENIKYVAKNLNVRKFMVSEQQKLTVNKNNVVIGRDITTVVLPNAELKIYFDCSVEKRAQRRFEQNQRKNIVPNVYQDILRQIKERDQYDKQRSCGALKVTQDSWYIDTSFYSQQEVYEMIINKINQLI